MAFWDGKEASRQRRATWGSHREPSLNLPRLAISDSRSSEVSQDLSVTTAQRQHYIQATSPRTRASPCVIRGLPQCFEGHVNLPLRGTVLSAVSLGKCCTGWHSAISAANWPDSCRASGALHLEKEPRYRTKSLLIFSVRPRPQRTQLKAFHTHSSVSREIAPRRV